VLIAGGANVAGAVPADLYDPVTGSWSVTGPMMVARDGQTATLLPDGTVLVAGGTRDGSLPAERYSPATHTWTIDSAMTASQWGAVTAVLPNGDVLVAGGSSTEYTGGGAETPLASAERYLPATKPAGGMCG
jgi:hypothetical protein